MLFAIFIDGTFYGHIGPKYRCTCRDIGVGAREIGFLLGCIRGKSEMSLLGF